MGILWGDWIAQPAEHRALYLAIDEFEKHVDAYDDGERERVRPKPK
jgi:hypothetical protein